MSEPYLGTDIAFNKDFLTVPTGDTNIVTGRKCLGQDLVHRYTTPRGDLWYETVFGFDIYKYLHLENTETNRLDLKQEAEAEAEKDPRVEPGSTTARVVSWEQGRIKLAVSCRPVTGGNSLNMVFNYSTSEISGEVVS